MIECVVVRMRMDGRMSEQEVCELQACSGGLGQELWTRRSPSHSYPSTASGGLEAVFDYAACMSSSSFKTTWFVTAV